MKMAAMLRMEKVSQRLFKMSAGNSVNKIVLLHSRVPTYHQWHKMLMLPVMVGMYNRLLTPNPKSRELFRLMLTHVNWDRCGSLWLKSNLPLCSTSESHHFCAGYTWPATLRSGLAQEPHLMWLIVSSMVDIYGQCITHLIYRRRIVSSGFSSYISVIVIPSMLAVTNSPV